MMKNFPSLMAVVGAWFCAFGFVQLGIVAFLISSIWAIIVQEDTSVFTMLFLSANIVAFWRILGAAI